MSTKTHKGIRKRLKRTATGKLVHRSRGKRHLLSNKSSRRRRRLAGWRELDKGRRKAFKRQYGVM